MQIRYRGLAYQTQRSNEFKFIPEAAIFRGRYCFIIDNGAPKGLSPANVRFLGRVAA